MGRTVVLDLCEECTETILADLKSRDETARAYNGALETPAPDVEYKVKAFEAHVKERINNTLRDEYHDVDQKVLTNLITDAQAGV